MELAKKIINIMELNGIKSGSNFIKTKNRNVWLRKISPGTLKPSKKHLTSNEACEVFSIF